MEPAERDLCFRSCVVVMLNTVVTAALIWRRVRI